MNENNVPNLNTNSKQAEQNQVVIPTTENNPDNMDMPYNGLNPNTMMTPVEPTVQTPTKEEPSKIQIKPKTIITVITVCLVIGLITYLVILGTKEKEENIIETEKLTKEQKEKDIDEPIALSEHAANLYIDELENIVGYLGKEFPTKTSNIDNNKILTYAFYKYVKEKNEGIPEDFKQLEITSRIIKTFGKDFKYNLESIKCPAGDGLLYEYNSEEKIFTITGNHGHGGPGYNRNKIFLIEATKTKEEIVIKTRIVYGGFCSDVCGPITDFYKDANATEKLYQSTKDYEDESEAYKDAYENTKDKLPITTFIYKKQSDGNYGLTEINVK